MENVKRPTTFQEQLELLKSRNCTVENDSFCLSILSQVNYYRLTAYLLPFKIDEDHYRDGTSFDQVYRIYEFDRRIRSILLSALEDLEVYLRTQLAYYHAHTYDALGYLDHSHFVKKEYHDKFVEDCDKAVEKNKNLPFVAHHLRKYNGSFPIWVIVDLLSFGTLSHFYKNMLTVDRKIIASSVFMLNYQCMESYLRCCTDLRNICAHYGRLYNRIFTATPKTPLGYPIKLGNRLFDQINALKLMFPSEQKWNLGFLANLTAVVEEYAQDIDFACIGFPQNYALLLRK